MKTIKYIINIAFVFLTPAFAKLNIITSIPDISDIAYEIGGDSIAIFSLATGMEDMHQVQARSSFLPKINRADFVMCLGLEMENAWLVPIVDASRNDRVKKGAPGWIEVYKGIEILEKPLRADTIVHVGGHRLGNPHINEGPYCGEFIAQNIYNALISLDKKNERYFHTRLLEYDKKLEDMMQRLKKKAEPLKGVHVISYHADLAYFCYFYGMVVTGCLEPQPGMPPNAKHLTKLIAEAKRDSVKLILYHQAQNPRLPLKIAEQVNATPICFANMVKSRKEINTFIELQEYNLDLMLNALSKAGVK